MFSNERQQGGGFEWEGMWGAIGISRGRDNHNRDILYLLYNLYYIYIYKNLFLIRGVYLRLQLSDGFLGLVDILLGCIFHVANKHVLTGGLTTLSVGLVMVP